ncbi:ubiquinol-cytochrome c reductase cytochrome c1 subunit [Colwellia chukchiensis]|uniref:Ubiquinol-cytochrome c reductase cytochrome c1 subunit n=1 Tax=Colwellia chukchiensis TaxID=641665 RepID=A0A1H7LDR3_9GAMM|nr:cytochrome c1 [Colwellia chukchiensis]SEK97102.1 ubiquinol-cytochrome c reductase cytochrome c1 subunit [Colwellia chukchiensis]
MKKFILAVLAMLPMLAIAAGPSLPLDKANNDLSDKASLKRGFEAYINNCLACHELKYQRYNRTFADLGISDADGMANYMYTGEKVGDHITNTMPAKEAAKWFGTAPPDLTLAARFRSPDWIYTYLRSFYVDESRPFGVNNKVFKDVGMPHVLQNLQGVRTMDEDGNLSEATGGTMTAEEYDEFARDLTNFLEYTGEPNKLERESLGYWVIGFLFILLFFAYLLKKEYWRDVH